MMYGSLPARLRVLRARQGLTLIEAAEKLGIGRDTLSDLERGNRHPVMPTLAKIARGYEVPVEDLLEEPALAVGKAEVPREMGPSLAQEIRAGQGDETEEGPAPTRILHDVLDRDLFERVARGELSVDEAMSLAPETSGEYDEVLIPRSRLDAEAFWAAIEAIKDHQYQMDELSVMMKDGYVEVGLKVRENA